ncbi:hypothetical protein OUZ56_026230 [Daphnia magna]|uniref:Uncharacterized protein n=1 Tax=Daphnia magna TaxID=35525 RepID=A0ABQ9ZL67_9CRUS|nr:hypothetical protein OUZ56_026230 [Daphnia magna]
MVPRFPARFASIGGPSPLGGVKVAALERRQTCLIFGTFTEHQPFLPRDRDSARVYLSYYIVESLDSDSPHQSDMDLLDSNKIKKLRNDDKWNEVLNMQVSSQDETVVEPLVGDEDKRIAII